MMLLLLIAFVTLGFLLNWIERKQRENSARKPRIIDEKTAVAVLRILSSQQRSGLQRSSDRLISRSGVSRREGWWDDYKDYLSSNEWAMRRAAILDRDNHTCCICRAAVATQVHHLTYARAGMELDSDLLSVCAGCHESLHPEKAIGRPKKTRRNR